MGELIQQLREGLALTFSFLRQSVERLKRFTFAKLQNHLRARHPIRAFAVNQMADDVERAPRFFSFVPERPRFRQAAQERIESRRSTTEKRNCVL
jgi:hypothetical protein